LSFNEGNFTLRFCKKTKYIADSTQVPKQQQTESSGEENIWNDCIQICLTIYLITTVVIDETVWGGWWLYEEKKISISMRAL
jgi:hypothetical protein